MNVVELRNNITDLTGKIWRLNTSDERGYVFDWIHPDVDGPNAADGVQVAWEPDSDSVTVWSEDKELMFTQKIAELDARFTYATDYAQMAGGLATHFPDLTNKPTEYSCTQAVNAIHLSDDKDPAFCGGADGVSWWYTNEFVCEFNSEQDAFIVWSDGHYWIAATPAGYVASLKKAQADKEQMLFNKLKSDLEK